MAITDTPTTPELAADTASASSSTAGFPEPRGFTGIFGTGDHKTIGRLYIGFSLVFGLLTLTLTLLFDANGNADVSILNADNSFLAFTLGQLGIVLLFLLPLFLGLATAVIPLQVGARTIAFPRAAAAAFWAWLLSAAALLISYTPAVGGGIGIAVTADSKDGNLFTLLALLGLCTALLLATVCVVTTVVALRTAGMHLDQVPLFSWSMLVAGGVWLLTIPVFMANVALVFVDAKYGAPVRFGVDYKQWSQLAWFVTQPQVFAFAIPAVGIAGDAIVTFARARQPQRGAILFGIGLFGALSLGAYAQAAFFPGVWLQWAFVAQCASLMLPVLLLLGGLAMAVRHGQPKLGGPAILGFVSLLLLLVAAVAALLFGLGRLGLQYTQKSILGGNLALRTASLGSPVYAWGVAALVFAAAVTAAAAGVYYWAPKITGKKGADGAAKALGLVALVGGLLAGVPLLLVGFSNKFEGLADSANAMFLGAAAGVGVLVLVTLVTFVAFAAGRVSFLSGGSDLDADAWGLGQSLEWAADSPPAPGNFGALAHVHSPEPLFDLAENGGAD